jgi:hypothetical protein
MKAITSTFKPGEPGLGDLLRQVNVGEVQLPDFQRGWVWDDDHIRSLIASVSLSYPIGAVMLLQTGGEGAQFQPRSVQGASFGPEVKPELLILDGQQRVTSLYLALFSGKPVPTKTTKGQDIERVYYLDIAKCLDEDADRFEAVLSIPLDRKVTSDFGRKVELDLSSVDKEFEQRKFPLEALFDQTKYSAWRRGFQKYYRADESKLDEFDRFEAGVVDRIGSYRIPTIELLRDTPREAVCQVFEKVNTGGVTLTVFELVTAIFAADGFNLRDDWEGRSQRLREHDVLGEIDSTTFLMAITLQATFRRHQEDSQNPVRCARKDVLKLKLAEYRKYADEIEVGMKLAARFLAREKVFDTRMLPYTTQLIPLSAICSELGDRFEQDTVRRKLAQWYWSGVFGELYGGANESRFALDLPEVIAWIEGGDQPRTLRDASFSPTRLLSMQSRLSAAYKGLMALLMKAGSDDFLSGDSIEIASYFDMAIDIHHIFPKAFSEKQGYARGSWNSAVNKSPLSAKTNRAIGGKAPSNYLASIERASKMESSRLNEILLTHQISPILLRADSFGDFIRDRASRLLNLIEEATGKAVTGRDSDEVVQEFGGPLPLVKSDSLS